MDGQDYSVGTLSVNMLFLRRNLTLRSQWQNGHIQPNKVQHWQGGLDAIADGLQYMKEGKVSAAKIVYTI